jgi:hypothetical protein
MKTERKRLHEGLRKFARSGKTAVKEWKQLRDNIA